MAGLCATSDPIVGNNLDGQGFNQVKESNSGASWVSTNTIGPFSQTKTRREKTLYLRTIKTLPDWWESGEGSSNV